jgi:CubicO group peptidase (beta-lactamase class C family)/pimeloyl-ACP methyl ester carboxylesterase
VLRTIQGFSLSGEVSLPTTVEAFETYVNGFVGIRPPGLSMAIALEDSVLYEQAFGMADSPLGIPATPDTVYQWASVTKTMTAAAIMQLREQGLIDLDAPVSDYLDYFPARYPITVRHLLTHSSGLPEPADYLLVNLRLQGQPLADYDSFDREYYEGVSNLTFEPGSQSAYNNPPYVTLGQVVAAVSGQPYVEYVREHILNPLGMTNTDFTYSNDFMEANAAASAGLTAEAEALVPLMDEARGLDDGADFFREPGENYTWLNPYMAGDGAAGGLLGPVTEMIRFAQMMLNEGELDGVRLLEPESVALLQEVQTSTSGEPLDIGLAWHFGGDAEHPYIEHDGGGTFQTKLRLYMKDGFAVAIMANGSGFDRDELADAAANVVFSMMGAGVEEEEPEAAFTPPIPGGIASLETVTLGDVEQSILIRGADTTNPVLLWLHGGPGTPEIPFVGLFQTPELEENFVVVQWDQRGAGKSYSEDLTEEDMGVENFVSDTLELTDILRERFGQEKIFLFGHSWGSALGFLTIMEDSEPYYAYVAAAEAADWNRRQRMSYEWVLEQAQENNDTDVIQVLESIQPFDPTNLEHISAKNQFLDRYRGGDLYTEGLWDAALDYVLSGKSPEYTSADVEKTEAGMDFSRQTAGVEAAGSGYNLFEDFPVSPIPVHFFAGRHDHQTPGELAEEYYNFLEAPAKSFTWFENSGHSMIWDEPDKTTQELIRIKNETLNP